MRKKPDRTYKKVTKGPKKKSARNKNKFRALTKSVNLKSRSDLIDYDYIDKLTDKDKKWLNDFTEGWINADFREEDTKKLFENHEHIRKESYRRNNYRNFDIYTKKKTTNRLISLDEYKEQMKGNADDGLTLDELIDLKNAKNNGD